jgi:hypothetical protein
MANVRIKALDVGKPAGSLSYWLAVHHPDLFLTVYKQAQTARNAAALNRGMGRFAQDDGSDLFSFTSTPDDDSNPLNLTFDTSSAISPDLTSFTPGLTDVTVDSSVTDIAPNLVSDATDAGNQAVSQAANAPTSNGSTLGGTLASAGSSVLGALGTVASTLTNPTVVASLASAAKAYFTAQGQVQAAQTQAAVLNTQLARVAAGQTTAPITYVTGANGQQIPAYVTQGPNGPIYTPVSSSALASLTPSSLSVFLSQNGIWVVIGLGVLALLATR